MMLKKMALKEQKPSFSILLNAFVHSESERESKFYE